MDVPRLVECGSFLSDVFLSRWETGKGASAGSHSYVPARKSSISEGNPGSPILAEQLPHFQG